MTAQKCKKCNADIDEATQDCQSCLEKSSKLKKLMTWFCIILLLAIGMIWAFTDSEPDVSISSPSQNVNAE